MSAVKQNPFILGFSVVMVLGVGALGYLAYSAADGHSKAQEEYKSAADDLSRLQGLPQYPNEENLQKLLGIKKDLQAKVDVLQKELAEDKIKIEPISPSDFQVRLRDTVARVLGKAPEANVKFPDRFYLAFDRYQTEPAKPEAAPVLFRELKAIESVMNLILDTKNVEVRELTREELDEEKDVRQAPPPPTGQRNRPGAAAAADTGKKLIKKSRFTLRFLTSQENVQKILNGIVSSKEQFFIPRYFMAINEKVEPPPKILAVPPPPPPAPEDPNVPAPAPTQPAQPQAEYVFGKESVEVTLDIELVDVADVEVPDADKKTVKSN